MKGISGTNHKTLLNFFLNSMFIFYFSDKLAWVRIVAFPLAASWVLWSIAQMDTRITNVRQGQFSDLALD